MAIESPDFATLTVEFLDKTIAKPVIVNNHYSRNWNTLFGVVNFGIYKGGRLLGVAVYGHPMNPSGWSSITDTPADKCLELNRLWISDELGANTETWFLAQTFKLLKRAGIRLIQSFADGRLGVGTIYQAANFTYHGYHSTTFHRDMETGEVYHGTPFSNTAKPTGMLFRNVMLATREMETFKVNTYRYLYPLDRRARKEIKIPTQPYPKERCGEIIIPDYQPPASQVARAALLAEALGNPSRDILVNYLATLTDEPASILAKQRDNKWIQKLMAA